MGAQDRALQLCPGWEFHLHTHLFHKYHLSNLTLLDGWKGFAVDFISTDT